MAADNDMFQNLKDWQRWHAEHAVLAANANTFTVNAQLKREVAILKGEHPLGDPGPSYMELYREYKAENERLRAQIDRLFAEFARHGMVPQSDGSYEFWARDDHICAHDLDPATCGHCREDAAAKAGTLTIRHGVNSVARGEATAKFGEFVQKRLAEQKAVLTDTDALREIWEECLEGNGQLRTDIAEANKAEYRTFDIHGPGYAVPITDALREWYVQKYVEMMATETRYPKDLGNGFYAIPKEPEMPEETKEVRGWRLYCGASVEAKDEFSSWVCDDFHGRFPDASPDTYREEIQDYLALRFLEWYAGETPAAVPPAPETCPACGDVTRHVPNGINCRGHK